MPLFIGRIPPEMFSSVPDATDLLIQVNPAAIEGGPYSYLSALNEDALRPLY